MHTQNPILLCLFGHGDCIINVTGKLLCETPGALSIEVKGFAYNMKAIDYLTSLFYVLYPTYHSMTSVHYNGNVKDLKNALLCVRAPLMEFTAGNRS